MRSRFCSQTELELVLPSLSQISDSQPYDPLDIKIEIIASSSLSRILIIRYLVNGRLVNECLPVCSAEQEDESFIILLISPRELQSSAGSEKEEGRIEHAGVAQIAPGFSSRL